MDMGIISRVERVVGYFDAWFDGSLPYAKMRVKVIDRGSNDFLAVANLSIRNCQSGDPEYISGIASQVEGAIQDLLSRFSILVRENAPSTGLDESNFEWSSPDEF